VPASAPANAAVHRFRIGAGGATVISDGAVQVRGLRRQKLLASNRQMRPSMRRSWSTKRIVSNYTACMSFDPRIVAQAYDAVAADYAARFAGELAGKPFDRTMLQWLAARVTEGPICDLGCGPGQIAAFLSKLGAATLGLDLSREMVAQARRLHPGIRFEQADMLALEGIADNSLGGIAAFYSIIHLAREAVPTVLAEMQRVLRKDGVVLLSFHIGEETRHFDEFLGQPVDLDFAFFTSAEIKSQIAMAGLEVTEVIEREPYASVEVETRRAYIFARKP
jgi:ubiquinone/menaquinone biosynthesis C-methylase UbiE